MASRIPHRTPGPSAAVGRAARARASSAWSVALLGLLALDCQRSLPGPDECVAFAESWLRARRPATQLEADTAFDELVRRCLTEPYDRELVTCVVGGHNQERCRVDYARRVEARRELRSR
jgi:hypothetical protein